MTCGQQQEILGLKLDAAYSGRLREDRWMKRRVRKREEDKSDEIGWVLSGRPQMETFNSQRERPEKSQMEETQEMGYQTQRKKKERQKDGQSSAALKSHFLYPPTLYKTMAIFVHTISFHYPWTSLITREILTPSKWPWNPASSMDLLGM